MTSQNEWGQLKKVVVGVADYARVPEMDRSLRYINYADRHDVSDVVSGQFPDQVIQEANEDLEGLVAVLQEQGVEVVRPNREYTDYYNFCPRDCIFTHRNVSIATPMPLRSRKDNWKSYGHHLDNLIRVPCSYEDELYTEECIGNKDVLSLTESSPSFDAANVIRANDDLLYLVSNTGNLKGAELLQELVGAEVKVHLLQGVYSYVHIDSTVAFLREGLVMVNPSRVKSKDDLPEPFRSWEVIFAPEPYDTGYYGNYNNASPWGNLNLLSINPNLVVLEEHQHETRKELEKYGIESIMLPWRHGRTLAGFFHCVTLDLDRDD
jgi:N-dimethylarginine dimethylaminohydrolase